MKYTIEKLNDYGFFVFLVLGVIALLLTITFLCMMIFTW